MIFLQILIITLYVLLGLAAVLAVLFAAACIRAAVNKKEYCDDLEYSMERDSPDWQRYAGHLSSMVQVSTVTRRGETDLAEIYRFHALLEELYPRIHRVCEKTELDGALLFRWKGRKPELKPILLMSHHDVVEAAGKWKYQPFSGAIAEGKIWGRGTVDTKGALCAILESVEELIKEGFTPLCDVYIASSNNKTVTGDGAVKTVEYLYTKGIFFDLVMDEGGSIQASYNDDKERLAAHSAMIGVMEKGRANIKFIARSRGGHASVPFHDNPFARLAKLVYIAEHKSLFKKRITKPVIEQYRVMAPYMRHFRHRLLYGNLWLFRPIAPYIMHKKGGAMAAVVKTTCIFTMAEGSEGANVIPERATMTANCRFMLHEPLMPSYAKLARLADKLGLEMEMATGFDVTPVADMSAYAYKYVGRCIKRSFGEIPQIPYIMPQGTDARHYTKICDCVLRFVPLMMTGEQLGSSHAVNENINLEALSRAVNFYRDFLLDYGKNI